MWGKPTGLPEKRVKNSGKLVSLPYILIEHLSLYVGQASRLAQTSFMKDELHSNWTASVRENRQYRRDLPHFQNPGHLYFCTASTHERRTLSPEERDIVMNSIRYLDGKQYDLYAAVVMPDHFHIVVRPHGNDRGEYVSLSKIFHLLKGYTARTIGGHVWQHETYDHQVRNDQDLYHIICYMRDNPVKAGLTITIDDYKWWWHYGMRESIMWDKPTGLSTSDAE